MKELADDMIRKLRGKAETCLLRHSTSLTVHERKLIKHGLQISTDHAVFYLTPKIHKSSWKSRPIFSCPSILLFNLGKWVSRNLQAIASVQQAYFKDSKDLKLHLDALDLPPTVQIFSTDAVSTYINIDTTAALFKIAQYIQLRSRRLSAIPLEELM